MADHQSNQTIAYRCLLHAGRLERDEADGVPPLLAIPVSLLREAAHRLAPTVGVTEFPMGDLTEGTTKLFDVTKASDTCFNVWSHEGDLIASVRAFLDEETFKPNGVWFLGGASDYAVLGPMSKSLRFLSAREGVAWVVQRIIQ